MVYIKRHKPLQTEVRKRQQATSSPRSTLLGIIVVAPLLCPVGPIASGDRVKLRDPIDGCVDLFLYYYVLSKGYAPFVS